MTASRERSLLFLHVRKTGGTSFYRVLSNRFAARDCLVLAHGPAHRARDFDALRFIAGHFDASCLGRFRSPPFLITCLREPLDRTLSVYSYYRSFPLEQYALLLPDLGQAAYERRVFAMRLARECSIDEFMRRAPEAAREHLGDVQTRVFCGLPPEATGERLDAALRALERCDFLGLTERLDESAAWLARRLGWAELGPLPRENVSAERLRRDELSAETLGALRRLTALDAELYRRATELYEKRIAEWKRAADPRDHSLPCTDAAPVPDLRFEEAIRGGGWLGRERVGDEPWFCWIGGRRAWVDLRVPYGADRLVVEVAHVIDPSVAETIRLAVNGTVLTHELRSEERMLSASAPVPSGLLQQGGTARVELTVGRTARPCDVNPGSPDRRELSIAVRRIALVAGAPLSGS